MSFDFLDSFAAYPDINSTPQGLQGGWVFPSNVFTANFSLVPGRFADQDPKVQAVEITAVQGSNSFYFGQPVSSQSSRSVGCAFKLVSPNPIPQTFLTFWTTGPQTTMIAGVGVNASQQLFLWVGTPANVVATTSLFLPTGGWHYIETEWTAGVSAGNMTLWVDGIRLLNFTGNTGAGPNAFVGYGWPSSGTTAGQSAVFGDVYSKTGAVRNGEGWIEALTPNSNVTSQWSPLTGSSNFAMVDALPVAGDAAYVFAATPTDQDLYGVTPLVDTPLNIYAVQVRVCARKDDATTRTMAGTLKSGATQVNGPTFAVSGSYQYNRDIYPTDPNTSAAWTPTNVNAINVGQEVIS